MNIDLSEKDILFIYKILAYYSVNPKHYSPQDSIDRKSLILALSHNVSKYIQKVN